MVGLGLSIIKMDVQKFEIRLDEVSKWMEEDMEKI